MLSTPAFAQNTGNINVQVNVNARAKLTLGTGTISLMRIPERTVPAPGRAR